MAYTYAHKVKKYHGSWESWNNRSYKTRWVRLSRQEPKASGTSVDGGLRKSGLACKQKNLNGNQIMEEESSSRTSWGRRTRKQCKTIEKTGAYKRIASQIG